MQCRCVTEEPYNDLRSMTYDYELTKQETVHMDENSKDLQTMHTNKSDITDYSDGDPSFRMRQGSTYDMINEPLSEDPKHVHNLSVMETETDNKSRTACHTGYPRSSLDHHYTSLVVVPSNILCSPQGHFTLHGVEVCANSFPLAHSSHSQYCFPHGNILKHSRDQYTSLNSVSSNIPNKLNDSQDQHTSLNVTWNSSNTSQHFYGSFSIVNENRSADRDHYMSLSTKTREKAD